MISGYPVTVVSGFTDTVSVDKRAESCHTGDSWLAYGAVM